MKSSKAHIKPGKENLLIDQIKHYIKDKYINIEALESINQLFIETRDNLTSTQVNDIVSAYAQIDVINPTFLFKELHPFILKKQSSLTLQSQIKISHLFAKKDFYSERFCQQLVSNFTTSSEILSSSELIDLQWSLGKIRYFDQNFFQIWENRIVPHVGDLGNHDLVKSVLAVAKNDYFSEKLTREFVNTLKERELSNHDLINAIYGLTLIMTTKNQEYLQQDICELLIKVDPSTISASSAKRELISSYNSLNPSYKDRLHNIYSVLNNWSEELRKEAQPTVSRSQSLIKDLLIKYDTEAQEEVWFEPLATNVDIYLPSIRTYVQVDGPTHFYRNNSSHYTTTSQFNSSFLEKEEDKHLLRIFNLNPRSYRKVISKTLNDRFFESNSPIQVTSGIDDITIEPHFLSQVEEMTTSPAREEESIVLSSKKPGLTHKATKKSKKKSPQKSEEEDLFLTIPEPVESTVQTTIKSYPDRIQDFAKKYKMKRTKDYYDNLFEKTISEMDFELASYLITNHNITKIDSFLDFLEKEASKENFNNHPQFEYSIEILNAAIEKNIFNEVDFMITILNNENIIKFLSHTDYDFDRGVAFSSTDMRNLATFMLMEKGYFDTVISLIKNEKLTHSCDQHITLPLVLCALYYNPQNEDEMKKQEMCLETLLENNFSAEVYDADFTTPIFHCFVKACNNNYTDNRLYEHYMNLGNILLSHDVSISVKPLAQGANLLWVAVGAEHEELVSKLLATNLPYGIDDFSHDTKGQNFTPLCAAISQGNVRISELLLKNGASPEGDFDVKERISISKIYKTPLLIAAEHNIPELINLLVKYGADINRPNKIGLTVMDKIIQRKTYSLCEAVIQNGFYNEKSFNTLLVRSDCSEEIKTQIRTYQSDPVSFILQAETLDQDAKIKSLTALSNAKSLPAEHRTRASDEIALLRGADYKELASITSDTPTPRAQSYAERIIQERTEQSVAKGGASLDK